MTMMEAFLDAGTIVGVGATVMAGLVCIAASLHLYLDRSVFSGRACLLGMASGLLIVVVGIALGLYGADRSSERTFNRISRELEQKARERAVAATR